MNIRVVDRNSNNIIKDKINTNFKIRMSTIKNDIVDDIQIIRQFKVGDKVKHKEENIIGEIKFIGEEKIAIVWNDNTRERLTLGEANKDLDYVDSIQTEVAPLTPQISKNNISENNEHQTNDFFDAALASLEDDENDFIESNIQVNNEKIDIEKIKMQQKINTLENTLKNKKTNTIKEKASQDLIDVMIIKGMIEIDDTEIEMQKIINMDDKEFNDYKQSVLDYSDGEYQITSYVESKNDLSEAERALQKIKNNDGKGIIGDFNNKSSQTQSFNISDNGKRSLGEIKNDKFTFNNQYEIQSFEESFTDILSNGLNNKNAVSAHNVMATNESLPGFENLQGLTKPLVVTSKSPSKFPVNSSIADLFGDLNWTIISK